MHLEERPIYQSPAEPPRKNFTDGAHWDLIVWFDTAEFKKIVGFQIGYKEHPFNTDEEFFLTLRPSNSVGAFEVEFGVIAVGSEPAPAAKLIRRVDRLPDTFFKKVETLVGQLPRDLRPFFLSHLETFFS